MVRPIIVGAFGCNIYILNQPCGGTLGKISVGRLVHDHSRHSEKKRKEKNAHFKAFTFERRRNTRVVATASLVMIILRLLIDLDQPEDEAGP